MGSLHPLEDLEEQEADDTAAGQRVRRHARVEARLHVARGAQVERDPTGDQLREQGPLSIIGIGIQALGAF